MTAIQQEFHVKQSLALAPRLQQSVQFLQMNTLEFQHAIAQALANNPFLEDLEESGDTPDDETGSSAASESPDMALPEPSYSGDYPNPRTYGADLDPHANEAASTGMTDILMRALSTLPLGERDHALAAHVIESLDGDGYLREPLESLARMGDFVPAPSACEWRTAIARVQQLDRPGLAARDLQECLLLQLQAVSSEEGDDLHALCVAIVQDHLPRLARNDWNGLCRSLDLDSDTLAKACAVIRGLDPRPGRHYDISTVSYVVPDVIVERDGRVWRVRTNEAALPRVRLHSVYAEWFRSTPRSEHGALGQDFQEARWLMRNIEQRHTTIRRVAEAIVARQHRFFDYGDVALRPLMLREVANDLEIHESTVSRATAGKYMMTPRGLYEFRHFFSRKLDTQAGGACSANAVRALIRDLVTSEDPQQPLSDVDLSRELARHGILLARRTVTKYRGQQKIPSAELRRVFAAEDTAP